MIDSAEVLAELPIAPSNPAVLPHYAGRRMLGQAAVDNSASFPPVSDQGQSGNCSVMSAVYGIRTYLERIPNLALPTYALAGDGPFGNNATTTFSPTFTYNQPNVNKGVDNGSTLVAVSDSLKDVGAVPWTTVRWLPTQPGAAFLTAANVAAAANYKISAYDFIDPTDTQKLKDYLAAGSPIYFAMDVDTPLGSVTTYWNGVYDGSAAGGHAMVMVGYDDNIKPVPRPERSRSSTPGVPAGARAATPGFRMRPGRTRRIGRRSCSCAERPLPNLEVPHAAP